MIRPMEECHVQAIADLEKACFSDPWSVKSIASELENDLSFWLVDEREGALAGYVGSQSVPPESDVMNLAVNPAFRRQGIGRALMLALMRELSARGMESLTLEVRASNAPAIALYMGLGFQQIGRRPRYYANPTEDALILRKELCHADLIN